MENNNQIIVYTYGVFDLFHRGHVELLRDARKLGDKLVLGLFTDEVAESFKRKPIISLQDRIGVLITCKYVDEVVVQDTLEPDGNILKIKPHILAKGPGAGWQEGNEGIPGEKAIKKVGGKIIILDYHEGISTSGIIKYIQSL